eukprot:2540008-Amphidinium_carterae.1
MPASRHHFQHGSISAGICLGDPALSCWSSLAADPDGCQVTLALLAASSRTLAEKEAPLCRGSARDCFLRARADS